MSTRIDFINAMTLAAHLCDRELKEAVLAVYDDCVKPHYHEAVMALRSLYPTLKPGRFPSAEEIMARMGKATQPADHDALARDAAAQILAAISKCGWNNPEAARKRMGELAWSVVELQGGWSQVCEIRTDQVATYQAQWRDLAKSQLVKQQYGGNFDNALPSGRVGQVIGELCEAITIGR